MTVAALKRVQPFAARWCIRVLAAAVVAGSLALPVPAWAGSDAAAAGRAIYETGISPLSGSAIVAAGAANRTVSGAAAACVACHRASGFGMFEGSVLVPPVTGPALFRNEQPQRTVHRVAPGSTHREADYLSRPAYDAETLARAIRDGKSSSGHTLDPLMPRYKLADNDLQALIAYLRELSAVASPGIDRSDAHFATVIAPGVPAEQRAAVIEVLERCFKDRFAPDVPGAWRWHLHVWDLEGPPDTWRGQLGAYMAKQPVFAVVSGIGSQWKPVHDYCESERLPCLYPNVEVPGGGLGSSRYNFYFSAGVLLEARVIARYLKDAGMGTSVRRVVQIMRDDDAGAEGAVILSQELATSSVALERRSLSGTTQKDWAAVLNGVGPGDALVLWMRAQDAATLATVTPPQATLVIASGTMAGHEKMPLPAAWKRATLLTYPLDAPARLETRREFNLRPWLKKFELASSDETVQGNTLAACNLLIEGVLRLRGYFYREYLADVTEDYPVSMGNAPAAEAYPRFSAGIGQRFSSRGAYIVRFDDKDSTRLLPVRDWIVP